MAYTVHDLRLKYPTFSEEALADAVKLLNGKPAAVRDIWAGEDQVGDRPQAMGPDGLTAAQRDLNTFAEENALPTPFPVKRPKI